MLFGLFKTKKVVNIGCFGKLPIYADFIKLRSENKELSLFDKWIQEGIHFAKTKLEQNFKEHYRRSLYYNFIFQPKNSDKSIVGTLFPGMDESGRFFPFVIFIPTDRYQINSRLGIFISYLHDIFFANASDIAKNGWTGLQLNAFLKKYIDREILLNVDKRYKEDYNNYIKTETIGSYFNDLHGNFSGENRYLIFQNLLDVVNPLSKENFSRFSLGIKFPLSPNQNKHKFQVAFWLDLVSKVFPLKKIFPNLFWSNGKDSTKPNLLCYLNEPFSKHFLSLLDIDSNLDDSMCDLSEMRFSKIEDIKSSMEDKYLSLLRDTDITLEKFLSSLGRY